MTDFVTIRQLVKHLGLEVVHGKEYLQQRVVTVSDISRPGLELTGYFNYYPHNRIQLFGLTEISYANSLSESDFANVMHELCASDTPAFVVSRGLTPPIEMVEAANKAKIPILQSKLPTTRLSAQITEYLDRELAERKSIHGVLVDIYGIGVLITGDSGVGKSETALELIKKGHRLIADDRVDVYQESELTIVGRSPKILEHMLEIRGVGIVDVMTLFGTSAVREEAPIDLVVYLEDWTPDKTFDRLGSAAEKMKILDVDIPKVSIPVKVGRNISIIIEVAAINFRAKNMGYDATKTFTDRLNQLIQENSNEEM